MSSSMKEFDTEYKDFNEDLESEIDLVAIWNKLKRSWKRIAVWACAGIVAGLVVGFSIPKSYNVVSRLAPELSNNTVNRLSSLVSLAGMNANSLGSSDAVYPMVYPEIVHSTPFVVGLFDMPVEVTSDGQTIQTTLYDYVLNYVKHPWWGDVLGFPFKVLGWIKGTDEEEASDAPVDPFRLTPEQNSAAKAISSSFDASVDKKTLVMTIEVEMQDPLIAANLAKRVNDDLKKYVTEYRTEKAKDNVKYFEKISEEARQEYYAAQRRYANYVDSHQNVILRSIAIEADKLQNEMTLKYQLYNSTAQQLQNAQAKVQQETPVFTEIIPPTVPLKAAKPSKKKILFAFMVLGFVCGCVSVLTRKEE